MNSFDLNNFREQIAQMKKMGSMRDLMSKLPGMGEMGLENLGDADEEVKRIEGLIDSMTPAERHDPSLIDISRRRRIAAGSGFEPDDVWALVNQFSGMTELFRAIGKKRKFRM